MSTDPALESPADVESRRTIAALREEVARLTLFNEDKFRHLQGYCKAANEDRATIQRLVEVANSVAQTIGLDAASIEYHGIAIINLQAVRDCMEVLKSHAWRNDAEIACLTAERDAIIRVYMRVNSGDRRYKVLIPKFDYLWGTWVGVSVEVPDEPSAVAAIRKAAGLDKPDADAAADATTISKGHES